MNENIVFQLNVKDNVTPAIQKIGSSIERISRTPVNLKVKGVSDIKLPKLPAMQLPSVSVSGLKLPKVQTFNIPSIGVSNIKLPRLQDVKISSASVSSIKLPKIDTSSFNLPDGFMGKSIRLNLYVNDLASNKISQIIASVKSIRNIKIGVNLNDGVSAKLKHITANLGSIKQQFSSMSLKMEMPSFAKLNLSGFKKLKNSISDSHVINLKLKLDGLNRVKNSIERFGRNAINILFKFKGLQSINKDVASLGNTHSTIQFKATGLNSISSSVNQIKSTTTKPIKLNFVASGLNVIRDKFRVFKDKNVDLHSGVHEPVVNDVKRSFIFDTSKALSALSVLREKISALGVTSAPEKLVSVFTNAFAKIGSQADRVMEKLQNLGTVTLVGNEFQNTSAGIKDTLMSPVTVGADFEHAMSGVAAVSLSSLKLSGKMDEYRSQLAMLTAKAQELGSSTAWTSTEVAEGMQFLGMAGFGPQQIYDSMAGITNLASSGGISIERAADIASNVANTYWGKDAPKHMQRVADVMASVITSHNVDVSQLGESYKYAAPAASGVGISFETLSESIGLMGDSGVQGSMSGTSLRKFITRIAAPPKVARASLESMKVKSAAYTDEGKLDLRSFPDLLNEIAESLKNFGTADRQGLLADLAGLTAVSGTDVLVRAAGKGKLDAGIARLGDKGQNVMKNGGMSQAISEERLNNVKGQYTLFQSAFQGLQTRIFDSVKASLTPFIHGFTKLANAASNFVQNNKNVVASFMAVGGAVTVVLAGLAGFFTVTLTLKASIIGLSAAASMLSAAFLPLTFIGGLGSVIYNNWHPIKALFSGIFSSVSIDFSWMGSALSSVKNFFTDLISFDFDVESSFQLGEKIGDYINNIPSKLSDAWESVRNGFYNLFSGLSFDFSGVFNGIKSFFVSAWQGVKNLFSSAWKGLNMPEINMPEMGSFMSFGVISVGVLALIAKVKLLRGALQSLVSVSSVFAKLGVAANSFLGVLMKVRFVVAFLPASLRIIAALGVAIGAAFKYGDAISDNFAGIEPIVNRLRNLGVVALKVKGSIVQMRSSLSSEQKIGFVGVLADVGTFLAPFMLLKKAHVIFKVLSGAALVLAGNLGSIPPEINAIASSISGIDIGNAFSGLSSGIANAYSGFMNLSTGMKAALIGAFAGMGLLLGGIIRKALKRIRLGRVFDKMCKNNPLLRCLAGNKMKQMRKNFTRGKSLFSGMKCTEVLGCTSGINRASAATQRFNRSARGSSAIGRMFKSIGAAAKGIGVAILGLGVGIKVVLGVIGSIGAGLVATFGAVPLAIAAGVAVIISSILTIPNALETIKNAFAGIKNYIVSGFTSAWESIKSGYNSVKNSIGNFFTGNKQPSQTHEMHTLGGQKEEMVQIKLTANTAELSNNIFNEITNIKARLVSEMQGLQTTISSHIAKAFDFSQVSLSGLGNSIKSQFTSLLVTINSAALSMVSNLNSTWSAMFTGMLVKISALQTGAAKLFASLRASIAMGLTGINSMVRSSLAGIGVGISTAFAGVSVGITAALSGISVSVLGMFASLRASIAMGLAGLSSMVLSSLAGIGVGVSTAFAGVSVGITAALSGVVSSAATMIVGVRSAISSGLSGLSSMVVSSLTGLKAGFTAAFQGMIAGISMSLSGLGQMLQVKVNAAFTSMKTGLQSKILAVKSAINTMFNGVGNKIVSQFNGMQAKIAAKFSGTSSKIAVHFNNVGVLISSKFGNVQIMIISKFKGIGPRIARMFAPIPAMIAGQFNSLSGLLSSKVAAAMGAVVQSINSFSGSLRASGAALMRTFGEGISSQAASVKAQVASQLAGIRAMLPSSDARQGPLSDLTFSGGKFVTTFYDGISSKANYLYRNVEGNLLSPIQSALQSVELDTNIIPNNVNAGAAMLAANNANMAIHQEPQHEASSPPVINQDITININTSGKGSDINVSELVEEIKRQLAIEASRNAYSSLMDINK